MTSPRTASFTATFAGLALGLSLAACGGDDDHHHDDPDAGEQADAAPEADAAPSTIAVTIPFAARVDGVPFACGETYAGVGSTAADLVAGDFRFYVHAVELRVAGGDAYEPVVLDDDDAQEDGLALLDFEDATADCEMGSASTHTALTGQVAAGAYSGIRFKLGVPFEQNHLDPEAPLAPLDQSGMSWAWQFGYKFLKVDASVGGEGFSLHLGSTGCPGDAFDQAPTGPCAAANVADVELAFDPASDTIVADVGRVLAEVDVATNTPDTAPGCMSFPGDPECDLIFPHLGLPFGETAAAVQTLFSVE